MSLRLPVAPPGYELRVRAAIVRLREPAVHTETNHACLGLPEPIEDAVYVDADDLVVRTTFDGAAGEEVVAFGAEIDYQLAAKRVTVGPSGGGSITRYTFRSAGGQVLVPGTSHFGPLDNVQVWWISVLPLQPDPCEATPPF